MNTNIRIKNKYNPSLRMHPNLRITTLKKISINLSVFSLLFFRPFRIMAQIRDWNDLNGNGIPAGTDTNGTIEPASDSCLIDGVPTLKCLEVVVANLLFISNALILLVLFIMFVIGSYRWLLSFGQPEKLEGAKKTFTWAIIGLLVYVSAYIILFTIDTLFLGGEGKIFRFEIGSYGL